uniref:Uncharacterized protein n=1 Tax=Cryptomonas curvata TaxID=233186 RepID=A0A7S0MVK2_9CRYP|mmetsp:Transcript_5547/g.12342  ORF Transcript_5547/g.12342 Transcript_5547/m.12342 type:complete len:107 (+) Transcript_5547:353-673(+)
MLHPNLRGPQDDASQSGSSASQNALGLLRADSCRGWGWLLRTEQTPKLETDRNGSSVDNLWLVEVTVTGDETTMSVESAVKMLAAFSEKLFPYVTLHNPEERKVGP